MSEGTMIEISGVGAGFIGGGNLTHILQECVAMHTDDRRGIRCN